MWTIDELNLWAIRTNDLNAIFFSERVSTRSSAATVAIQRKKKRETQKERSSKPLIKLIEEADFLDSFLVILVLERVWGRSRVITHLLHHLIQFLVNEWAISFSLSLSFSTFPASLRVICVYQKFVDFCSQKNVVEFFPSFR